MPIKRIQSSPLYTKQQIKNELKAAGTSAALSGCLTLALNKGQDIKRAGKIAGIAAGVSLAIGFVQRVIAKIKSSKEETVTEKASTRMNTHQG